MIDTQLLGGLGAAAMAMTAAGHTIVGEKTIVAPLLALDASYVRQPLVRWKIRFGWHITTALMLASAALVWHAARADSISDRFTLLVLGATWLGAGIVTLIGSKARHIGWPWISVSGLFALLSAI